MIKHGATYHKHLLGPHQSLALRVPLPVTTHVGLRKRLYSSGERLSHLGPLIQDKYAVQKEKYLSPKSPVVLCHGFLGFDQLRLAGNWLPGIQYWRGIEEAMEMVGTKVFTTAVPPAGSIEERAQALQRSIAEQVAGERVNIIAGLSGYSVDPISRSSPQNSGLDSRHLISRLQPSQFEVASLTTIATPHRGSSLADFITQQLGDATVTRASQLLQGASIPAGAFTQLTREYLRSSFNPATLDDPRVRYYSFGACFDPAWTSIFKQSHDIIAGLEGANDGVVSVSSSVWGEYKGTLVDVSHLDLINWTNRIRWWVRESLLGKKRTFNAVALYLDIADLLAREGL